MRQVRKPLRYGKAAAPVVVNNRSAFDCGDEALNLFLQRHARQSHEKGSAKSYLVIDDEDNKTVLGYYSVSSASITYERTPAVVKRSLARYEIPVFLWMMRR